MSRRALEKASSDPSKVKKLSLDLGEFATHEFANLFSQVAKFPFLEKLSLYGSIEEIPAEIRALDKLKSLSIQSSEAGRNFFPEDIGNLESLEELIIERTDITSLPESIGNLKNLLRISISQTNLSEIPSTIGNLQFLETLSCSECQLYSIPNEISKLKKLKELYLDGVFTIIPNSISELTELRELSLDGKFISLPACLSSFSYLTYLFLSGRFEKLVRGECKANQPFSTEGLPNELLNFEQISAEKFALHKQTVSWPIYEDSSFLQKRPLKQVPVLSSFKIVGMPWEVFELNPSTTSNLTAARAFLDGSPLVFVSDAEPDTISSIEGLCQIGVMVKIIEHYFYSNNAELKLRCLDRVIITEVNRSAQIVLATIDSLFDEKSNTSDSEILPELKEIALAQQEQYLKSIRTPKSKLDRARKMLEDKLPQAIKNSEASFLFAASTNIKYVDKQTLLTIRSEKQRLQFLKNLWVK